MQSNISFANAMSTGLSPGITRMRSYFRIPLLARMSPLIPLIGLLSLIWMPKENDTLISCCLLKAAFVLLNYEVFAGVDGVGRALARASTMLSKWLARNTISIASVGSEIVTPRWLSGFL